MFAESVRFFGIADVLVREFDLLEAALGGVARFLDAERQLGTQVLGTETNLLDVGVGLLAFFLGVKELAQAPAHVNAEFEAISPIIRLADRRGAEASLG